MHSEKENQFPVLVLIYLKVKKEIKIGKDYKNTFDTNQIHSKITDLNQMKVRKFSCQLGLFMAHFLPKI